MDGRAFRGVAALVTVLGLPACSDTADGNEIPSVGAIYTAVFRQLDLPVTVDEEVAIVYVVERSDDPLSLDQQVEVIQELADDYDVRFVDEIEAVAEITEDGVVAPPLDGALVAVGAVKDDEDGDDDVIVVRAEIMTGPDTTDAWHFSLRGVDEVQVVEADVTEPELLVPTAAP